MKWACITALAVGGALTTAAFVPDINSTGQARRWKLNPPDTNPVRTNLVNPTTRAIRYFLASDAYSSGNATAELNALRASFAQWQAIAGTVLKFEDAGLIAPGVDINTADHTNALFWTKTTTLVNGGNDDIGSALGVTFTSFASDNTLIEADIVFNGVQYTWFTDFNNTNSTASFVEAVAAHEIGHFIGLRHSPVGGATMLWRGSGGISVQAGLSSDEVAAANWLYAPTPNPATLAGLRGTVTMNGSPILGAVVTAEESASGNVIAGTVTRSDGSYELPSVPPGTCRVRVSPLDPSSATSFLARGRDIGPGFDPAETNFLPTTNTTVTLTGGQTTTRDFAVTAGAPVFRISRIQKQDLAAGTSSMSSLPVTVRLGQSNLVIGVASDTLPTNNATLTITGDGLTVGPTTFQPLGSLNIISVSVSVASNATPGLRSLVVQRGSDLAYANGFLEILPTLPDFNFDGLDDRFQRQYFPLFTAVEAGPDTDADGDGFINQAEYISGTNPTNALSFLKIESVTLDGNGSTITWQSGAGKRYQVWSRLDVAGDPWQTLGSPIAATGNLTSFTDASATNSFRFYRVQALP